MNVARTFDKNNLKNEELAKFKDYNNRSFFRNW